MVEELEEDISSQRSYSNEVRDDSSSPLWEVVPKAAPMVGSFDRRPPNTCSTFGLFDHLPGASASGPQAEAAAPC
jgi:hypothetical protein